MTTVKEMMEADLLSVFEDTILYGGASVQAEIQCGSGDEYKGFDDFDIRAVIRVRIKDIPTILSGDLIQVGAATWEVIGARLSKCGMFWEINVNRRTS